MKHKPSRKRIRARSEELRRLISRMDFVASGTLHVRTKVCGRKNCKCAADPAQRHGPYHEWTRSKDGKLHHRVVTSEQAELLQHAIANYREIHNLLARWEEETASEILNPKSAPGPPTTAKFALERPRASSFQEMQQLVGTD